MATSKKCANLTCTCLAPDRRSFAATTARASETSWRSSASAATPIAASRLSSRLSVNPQPVPRPPDQQRGSNRFRHSNSGKLAESGRRTVEACLRRPSRSPRLPRPAQRLSQKYLDAIGIAPSAPDRGSGRDSGGSPCICTPIYRPALRYWFVMPIDDLQQAAQKIAGFLATLNKLGGLRLKYRITAPEGASGGEDSARPPFRSSWPVPTRRSSPSTTANCSWRWRPSPRRFSRLSCNFVPCIHYFEILR